MVCLVRRLDGIRRIKAKEASNENQQK